MRYVFAFLAGALITSLFTNGFLWPILGGAVALFVFYKLELRNKC